MAGDRVDGDCIENDVHGARVSKAGVERIEIDGEEIKWGGAGAGTQSNPGIANAVDETGDEGLKRLGAAGKLKSDGGVGVIDDVADEIDGGEAWADCGGLVLWRSIDDRKRIGVGQRCEASEIEKDGRKEDGSGAR